MSYNDLMTQTEQHTLYATVYEVVREIPVGKVATYGQIARLIGLPHHARHVGFALSHLDSGHDVPWHRVVNAKGQIHTRHNGQPSYQQETLEAEGIVFKENGAINLMHFQWQP